MFLQLLSVCDSERRLERKGEVLSHGRRMNSAPPHENTNRQEDGAGMDVGQHDGTRRARRGFLDRLKKKPTSSDGNDVCC